MSQAAAARWFGHRLHFVPTTHGSPGRVLEGVQRRQHGRSRELVFGLHRVQVASHHVSAERGARRAPHAQLQRVLRVVLVLIQNHLRLKTTAVNR